MLLSNINIKEEKEQYEYNVNVCFTITDLLNTIERDNKTLSDKRERLNLSSRDLELKKIEYDLEYKLARKEELEEDSIEEIEIRANDLVVIDYIYEKLNREVCRMDINDYIWLLGQDKSKINKNYHRTRTIRY